MTREIGASLDASGLSVAIVASRFNSFVTKPLVAGAVDALLRHGAVEKSIVIVWVPGALEIPLAARRLAETGQFDGIVAVGAVIRGDTSHYDVVVNESARGLSRVQEDTGVPVSNAILSTETLEQAIDRSGAKAGNKGWDAAMAMIEMANVLFTIDSQLEMKLPEMGGDEDGGK